MNLNQMDGQTIVLQLQIMQLNNNVYSSIMTNTEDRIDIRLTIDNAYIDGLVQDCSNSSALALELLQSCT